MKVGGSRMRSHTVRRPHDPSSGPPDGGGVMPEFYGAGICGEEVLIGYLWFVMMRILGEREPIRLW